MNMIPITKDALVLRTDFSDNNKWEAICAEIKTPHKEYGFTPFVEFLSDKKFEGYSPGQILSSIPKNYDRSFIFIVDNESISKSEHPVKCLDLKDEPGRIFPVIPSEMWGVENNLSISNMDFEEFFDGVESDGVFRGFK